MQRVRGKRRYADEDVAIVWNIEHVRFYTVTYYLHSIRRSTIVKSHLSFTESIFLVAQFVSLWSLVFFVR